MKSLQELFEDMSQIDLVEVDAEIQYLTERLEFLRNLRAIHGVLCLPYPKGTPREKPKPVTIRDKIIAYLRDNPGSRATAIRKALGVTSAASIAYHLRRNKDLFYADNYHWYNATPKAELSRNGHAEPFSVVAAGG